MGWDAEEAEALYWESVASRQPRRRDRKEDTNMARYDAVRAARLAQLQELVTQAQTEIAALQEAEKKDQTPAEPDLIQGGPNGMIRFRLRYHGSPTVYTFGALRALNGRWYLTGRDAPNGGWSWDTMWAKLQERGTLVGAVELAVAWAHETGEDGSTLPAYSRDPELHKNMPRKPGAVVDGGQAARVAGRLSVPRSFRDGGSSYR